MSASGRPLAAASSSQGQSGSSGRGSDKQDPNRTPSIGRRQKRTLIESACSACRRRKSKCDGARPVCSRCQALRTECVYEAEEGESRWSALRRQNKAMESERDELREILIYLQSQPEADALEIFHHIRSSNAEATMQDSLQLVRQRRDGQAYAAPTQSGGQTRLPPIRSMIESAEAASPTSSARRMSMASDGSGASYSSLSSGHDTTLSPRSG